MFNFRSGGAKGFVAPLSGNVERPSFHGYTPATRWRPEWTPAFLVFQGGIPRTKSASITGGGQIYGREYTAMNLANIIVANAPGFNSITGGGQIPYDPAFLQPLAGGQSGVGS